MSGGSPLSGGSPESKIIIGLVVVAVILAAVAFALFAANQSQDKTLKARQAELDALGVNYSEVSADYAALNANYTRLDGQYTTVKANYQNVSEQYLALQNRSDAVDTRLNTFLEGTPTIAFTWAVSSRLLQDNTTDKVLTVTAYNLGRSGDATIKMTCTVRLGNTTSTYNQTFPSVMSLDKRVYSWEFGNESDIIYVWAGLG